MIGATNVGKYFYSKNNELTDIQIQKLTYYAYAWYMIINKNEKLFDEQPQAWIHGPVFRTLYHSMQYKRKAFYNTETGLEEIDRKKKSFLDTIYRIYGKYSGNELEKLTHSEMPWQIARKDKKPHEHSEEYINDEDIMSYYGS